jgi:nucleoside-diphosphate-sugar epimerase
VVLVNGLKDVSHQKPFNSILIGAIQRRVVQLLKILITGATGFIGQALVAELMRQNFNISIAVRQKTSLFSDKVKQFVVGDLENNPDFSAGLAEVDCVIHLAGKAHVLDKARASVLDEFRKINTELTLNLAKQAATAGVERFVFLSSIGVNGNQNYQPFLEIDTPNPQEPYAISKYEAEQGLLKLAKNSGLEVVLIRPPLVYGNNAPGNFGRLIQWASAKFILPLPLGAVNNDRSLIAIDNLVSFIIICTIHPKSANEIFLISDNDTLSTTQLLKKIAKAFNKKALLLPIPVKWMIFVAKLFGKEADAVRLFSSLIVDSSKARDLLDWRPVTTIDKQLCKITAHEKSI